MLLARLKSYLSFHHNHVQVYSVEKVLVVYLMSMMCLCKKNLCFSNMMAYGVMGLDQGQRDLWSRGTWVSTVLGCDSPHYLSICRVVIKGVSYSPARKYAGVRCCLR